jgi:hypothetical protein
MAWDIATATARVPGGSNATLIQTSFDTALAVAERYCNRNFMFTTEIATFTHSIGNKFQLSRYPVEKIISFTTDTGAAVTGFHSQDAVGLVVADASIGAHQVSIGYAAGYRVLPADLELALWMIFDTIWAQVSSPSGGGAAGNISSVSIPDVGRISFDTGNSSSSGSGASGGAFGFIPATAVNLLEPYRRKSC